MQEEGFANLECASGAVVFGLELVRLIIFSFCCCSSFSPIRTPGAAIDAYGRVRRRWTRKSHCGQDNCRITSLIKRA